MISFIKRILGLWDPRVEGPIDYSTVRTVYGKYYKIYPYRRGQV